jgi:predicted transcriptional regulator
LPATDDFPNGSYRKLLQPASGIIDLDTQKEIRFQICIENSLKREEVQLRTDLKKFEDEKKKSVEKTGVIRINVSGEIIMTTRETLTHVPKSMRSMISNGR